MNSDTAMGLQARPAPEPFELESVQNDAPVPGSLAHAYPRPDRGRAAWLFLWAGCYPMVVLTWGFPFSYGVFQLYYSTHEPFSSQDGLPAVGTTTLGILYLSAPISFTILQHHPEHRKAAVIAGAVCVSVALLASAFATQVWHLILTQGVLYGIGGSIVNTVTIQYLDEWFIERKGLAFGIQESAAGVGGIIIPVLMTWGLEEYGHKTMLIAWFLVVAILSCPAIYFLRARVSSQRNGLRLRSQQNSFSFMVAPVFLLLQGGNVIQALGNFLPGIHLPKSAGMLSLYNGATVIGCILTGYLIDRYHVNVSLILLSLGASSAVFFAWGFSDNFAELCFFAFLYGVFAGGWSSTWVGIGKEIQKRNPRADLTVLWGFSAAARGVGSIASGPISESLIGTDDTSGWPRSYGSAYGMLILFTGVMLALGSVGSSLYGLDVLGRQLTRLRQ